MPALFHYWVDFVIQTLSAAQSNVMLIACKPQASSVFSKAKLRHLKEQAEFP